MRMTSMNISLPEELKDYVEQQTKAGYSTPSEFIRELIRRDQKRWAKERLEQLLIEGLESGEPIQADEAFWTELKKEALSRIANRRSPLQVRKRQK